MEAPEDTERKKDGAADHERRHDALARGSGATSTPAMKENVREGLEKHEKDEGARQREEEEEEAELPVVPEADAIVYPRAVVVHLQNTSPADAAMVTTRWL